MRKYRGGFGTILEIEFLEDEATLNFIGDQGIFAPQGMLGGKEGAKTELFIIRRGGERFSFPFLTEGETIIRRRDRIILKTPGGGGYGDLHERDRTLILKDIAKHKGFHSSEFRKLLYKGTHAYLSLTALLR